MERIFNEYFSYFPAPQDPDILPKLNGLIYGGEYEHREAKWKGLGLSIKELENLFKQLTQVRIQIANKQGFSSYIELILDRQGIPKNKLENFTTDIESLIGEINRFIPNKKDLPISFYEVFNWPCLICLNAKFPWVKNTDLLPYLINEYGISKRYSNDIHLLTDDLRSHMRYAPESNSFEIFINQSVNWRHQTLDLIHELAHVTVMTRDLDKGRVRKSKFEQEQEVELLEYESLTKVSPALARDQLVYHLLPIRQVLFELQLYDNPNQDLGKLYAKTFNLCFKGAKQDSNPLFLIDWFLLMQPLTNLPHVLALYEAWSKISEKLNYTTSKAG